MAYRRLSFLLPRAAEEPLAARLWALGTLGLELADGADGRLRLDAWFTEPPPPPVISARWRPPAELVGSERVEEEEWLAAYRRRARPIRVGSGLVVDPRDEPGPAPAAGLQLHLPARRAFGTGGHASTRLAVELLERLPLSGRRVLDLGTGTGILAFVALSRGARSVVALDRDPVAAFAAADNRRRNRLWPALAAGAVGCLGAGRRFDLALANIRPEHLGDELVELAARLAPGGEALFSGLLAAEAAAWERRLAALGLAPRTRGQRGGWAALVARLDR